MGSIVDTQPLVVSSTGLVPWLGWFTERASVPLGRRLIGRPGSAGVGLCRRGYSVPDQSSPEFEPDN